MDIDLARDVCWLNGVGGELGGKWTNVADAERERGGCATLLGSQLSARVRNVRYAAIYLVDAAL